MTSSGRRHRLRRWVRVAAAGLMVFGGALLPAAPAVADEADVRVAILGITPVAPTSSSTLTVTGRVANGGFTEYTAVGVRLTLSSAPLPSRAAIRQVSTGSEAFDGAVVTPTQAVAVALRAGAQRRFTIAIPVINLPLGQPGVYVLGVEVVGTGPAGLAILGTARTLVPWVPQPESDSPTDPAVEPPIEIPDPTRPVNVAWLWPFATWPGRTPEGVLLRDTLPREISTGGRLRNLLDVAAAGPPELSWVADPELLEAVTDMTDGYLVERRGVVRAGTASEAAQEWLTDFQVAAGVDSAQTVAAARRGPTIWTLPYADIDADAVQRAGLDRDVVRAVTTGPLVAADALGKEVRGGLYWAPGGRVDPVTLNLLASAGVTAVVLREGALPLVPPTLVTVSGSANVETQFGPVRGLLLDSGLYGALTMPQGNTAQIIQARQRFLAETAFVALEASDQPVTLIAGAGNPRWDPNPRLLRAVLRSLVTAPWVNLTSLDSVVNRPAAAEPRVAAPYDARFEDRELDADYLARIVAAQESLASLRSVVLDSLALTEPVAEALLRAESSAWRTRRDTGADLVTNIQQTLDTELGQIRIVSGGTVTFSGDTGRVPATVANDLDRTVVIGLQLTAEPAARLAAETLTQIEIEPGRRASLEVPVRVIGGDSLPVTATVLDGRGQPIGEPSAITLQSTAYSRAALWVAIAAAVVLALLVVIDIVRRARLRHPRETS